MNLFDEVEFICEQMVAMNTKPFGEWEYGEMQLFDQYTARMVVLQSYMRELLDIDTLQDAALVEVL